MIGWAPMHQPLQLFGRRWCAHTQMLRRYLDRLGIPYIYRDMDTDPMARSQVRWWTGMDVNPVLYLNGNVLVEPSLDEVNWALRSYAYA
ncbi:MAG TPA: glutaredoxin family protein [Caldilineaceae bacterium]|nr:glutaredoxin family protein [Caldilineaceae bacterium]